MHRALHTDLEPLETVCMHYRQAHDSEAVAAPCFKEMDCSQTTSLGDVGIGKSPVIGVLALLRHKRSMERARHAEFDERFGVLLELQETEVGTKQKKGLRDR